MRPGRPASVCTGIWSSAGSTARWSRRGWCRSGRAIGSRPTRATRASSRGCSPAGCWSRSMCPRPSWRRLAIWCARARTRASIGCATGTGCRSSACATGGGCRPAPGASRGASGSPSSASSSPPSSRPSTPTCTRVDLVDRADRGSSSAAIRETAEQGPWRELVARLRCLRGIDTLTALGLVAEIGDFSRFQTAEEFMAFVGLVPSEHSSGEQRRQGSITKVGNSHVRRLLGRGRLARAPAAEGRLRARPPPARPGRRSWSSAPGAASSASTTAGSGWPPAASRSQKIVVACARELAGFVWAIATDQPLRST